VAFALGDYSVNMSETKIGINAICRMLAPSLSHTKETSVESVVGAVRATIKTLKADGFVLDSQPTVNYAVKRVDYEIKQYEKAINGKGAGASVHG